jgi:hypothetical protein
MSVSAPAQSQIWLPGIVFALKLDDDTIHGAYSEPRSVPVTLSLFSLHAAWMNQIPELSRQIRKAVHQIQDSSHLGGLATTDHPRSRPRVLCRISGAIEE